MAQSGPEVGATIAVGDDETSRLGTASHDHSAQGTLDAPTNQINPSSSTDFSGTTAQEVAPGTEKAGRRSLTGRRRQGSTSSSRRSQNAAVQAGEKTQRSGSAQRQLNTTQPRAKKKSGLLSFLNCCSAPEDSNDVGMQDIPQAAKVQPSKASNSESPQTATVPERSAEKVAEEKGKNFSPAMQTTNLATQKPLQGDSSHDQPMADVVTAETQAPVTALGEEHRGQERATHNTSNPPLAAATSDESITDAVLAANPNVVVQAPTPVSSQQHGEEVIADRTPEQQARDTDIEMTDVGPKIPLSPNEASVRPHDEAEGVQSRDATSASVGLPPPPPLEERQAQVASAGVLSPHEEISRQASPAEQPKWLLPSVRQEHRGRKCLILDLDETLVHSSFKVRGCGK